MKRRLLFGVLCLGALLVVNGEAQKRDDSGARLTPGLRGYRAFDGCGTARDRARMAGARVFDAVRDGFPVSFEQEPAILTADYTGPVTFRNFLVAGDVATVRFKSYNPEAAPEEVETWTRTTTRTVAGRLVSVFNPTWPSATLARILRRTAWGHDYPALYWGEFLPEGTSPGQGYHVRVRLVSNSLPSVPTRQIAGDVQYSSNVVNLVIPGFGDSRFGADDSIDFEAVTRKFYQHFADTYHSIAVTTQDVHVGDFSAFHRNVKNAVRGIGEDIFDDSARYGSTGALRGVEFYLGSTLTTNETSAHEMAHQWGSYFDWGRIMGLARAGHQPNAHDPLFGPGETLIGAVLDGSVQAENNDGAGWKIGATERSGFHPLTRYAMGILPRDQLPALTVFTDQAQFIGDREPAAGTPVNGGTREITVSHIAAVAGERSGPVDSVWRRAVVVVSRDRLLTQREMDYWTFFAQRGEDPNGSGVVSYDGFVSFDEATIRAIDLDQDIRPNDGQQNVQPLPVDYPEFAVTDFRDVRFDRNIASVYSAGERMQLTGRVTATDRNDFNQILIRFWKQNGNSDNAILLRGAISSSGSFTVEHEWQVPERGRYRMEVFLFWPGSGTQFPRSMATPITIG